MVTDNDIVCYYFRLKSPPTTRPTPPSYRIPFNLEVNTSSSPLPPSIPQIVDLQPLPLPRTPARLKVKDEGPSSSLGENSRGKETPRRRRRREKTPGGE